MPLLFLFGIILTEKAATQNIFKFSIIILKPFHICTIKKISLLSLCCYIAVWIYHCILCPNYSIPFV